jgi:hypothetical protein
MASLQIRWQFENSGFSVLNTSDTGMLPEIIVRLKTERYPNRKWAHRRLIIATSQTMPFNFQVLNTSAVILAVRNADLYITIRLIVFRQITIEDCDSQILER